MGQVAFIWDLEDDQKGNYWHICVEGHGVTREEVEEVLATHYDTAAQSRSSGQPEALAGRPPASTSRSFSSECPTTR